MKLPDNAVDLYYAMLRIRQVELRMESLYHLDEMKTPIHLCIGQEAIAVGVCAPLRREDYMQTNHRSHGHYLAKGGDLKGMIAELYGKSTGCASGRGGSMHLCDPSSGNLGASAIVGGGIPIATGMGLAIRQRAEDRVSVVFFGDGAGDEGTLYESLNFAILKRLPVIYVLEDNHWAVCSRRQSRQWGDNIFLSAPQDKLMSAMLDGNDVIAVQSAAAAAIARAREGQGPALLVCNTYRLRGHAGSYSDAKVGYRGQDEIDRWETLCPLARLKETLLAEHQVSTADLDAMQNEIEAEIDEAFRFAQCSPYPDPSEIARHVFREATA